MKTLNEIAYNVLNIVRGGRSSNNEHISEEQIKYTVLYYRSLLIRRDSASNGFADLREFEQTIPNLEVEILDPADGNLPSLGERGLMMRTKVTIPSPIRLNGRDGLTSVHSADFRYAFPVIDPSRAQWVRFSRYTGNDSRSFYRDGYVWLTGSKLTQQLDATIQGSVLTPLITEEIVTTHPAFIEVRGVFEDPREAYALATGLDFDDDSTPFPLSGDMEQRIVQSLLSGEFQLRPNDTKADNLPDPNGNQ